MTTTLDVDVTLARRIEVRMRMDYLDEQNERGFRPPFALGTAIDYLQGIENLLFLVAVEDWDGSPVDQSLHSPANFVRQVLVKRISYASPLEVVVSFATGIGVATLAANRLIDVWKNVSSARRQHSEDDLFIVAANVLQATIEAPIPIAPDTPGYARFQQAATVLTLLSSLEVEEEA